MTQDPDVSTATRRKFLTAAGAAGVAGLAGCTTSETSEKGGDGDKKTLSGEISIAGSSTVYPLAAAVAEEFQQKHPDVNITVQSTGSGAGFQNFFCVGKTDFNNASRPIQPKEEQLCTKNDIQWHEVNVATDALTVIVNNDADFVDCLTIEELEQIWKPDPVKKWSDIRSEWPDKEIQRYGAAETSGTFDFFTETVMGEEGRHTKNYQATENDNTIVQGVSGSKYAIGYFGFAYYTGNKEKVKALALDEDGTCVKPSLKTAKSGKYPLSRPLFTYPAKESLKEEHIAEFARFYTKKSADKELVADQIGYVPNTEKDMQSELDQLNQFIKEAQS